jgi:hypothetical protein
MQPEKTTPGEKQSTPLNQTVPGTEAFVLTRPLGTHQQHFAGELSGKDVHDFHHNLKSDSGDL